MKDKIFFVCPGIGRVRRGFETFMSECFEIFKGDNAFESFLFKGYGPREGNSIPLLNMHRNSITTKVLGSLLRKNPYVIEQWTFALSLVPYIAIVKPDLIFVSDGNVANVLHRFRRLFRFRFRILLSNGAPFSPPYPHCDHIQQLTPLAFEMGTQAGLTIHRQTLLPYGFSLKQTTELPSSENIELLRAELNLPKDKVIVLSVAALDVSHKRIDYLLREFSNTNKISMHLVLLGDRTDETSLIEALIDELGLSTSVTMLTVSPEIVASYYDACDYFVITSLTEGFGRVLIEALSHGLLVIAHDAPHTRFVVGNEGVLLDCEKPGALSAVLADISSKKTQQSKSAQRAHTVYERFSWESLRKSYVAMFDKVINLELSQES